jgi:hypothetical protein
MTMRALDGCGRLVEHYPCLTLAFFRAAVGGNRILRSAERHVVQLPDGREIVVHVRLVEHGYGKTTRVICMRCGSGRRHLHLVSHPAAPALVCVDCLRKLFRARYRSQTRRQAAVSACGEQHR